MLQRAAFACLHSHFKEENQLMCYNKTNCFHFVKIDNHLIKSDSDISVKTSSLGNGGESEKNFLYIFCSK
jgi:hypothetical protein